MLKTAQCDSNTFSHVFNVTSGVKQGGVLSPKLFAIYLDDLIVLLRDSGFGCYIIDLFVAAILYADNLALVAPTRSSLQGLIDICTNYGDFWCIDYNFKKTKVVAFGGNFGNIGDVSFYLKGKRIEMVNRWKYLGVTVLSGKRFLCTGKEEIKSFFRATNSVMNATRKPSNDVLMTILYSVCVPTLLYACEVKDLPSSEIIEMNTAVNNAIRKIVTFNVWESVRHVRMRYGRDSISEIYSQRKDKFLKGIPALNNTFLNDLITVVQ